MKKTKYLIIFLLLSAGIVRASTPVSIIQLLVAPAAYSDKEVVVSGFRPGSPNFLFLTKDHALMRDSSNAILLSFDEYSVEDECSIGYIKVFGTVAVSSEGVSLTKISRIFSHEKGAFCKPDIK